jgi:uncharacterized protein YjbI with pentapeptide repeats
VSTPHAQEPYDAIAILAEQRQLEGIDFTALDLRSAFRHAADPYTFTGCTFTEANLRGAQLPEVVFTDCHLDIADLTGALLEQAQFRGGSAAKTSMIDTDLTDAVFERIDLANSRWSGALLAGTRFTDSRLVGARMAECRGIGYKFERCHMGLAILTEMNFRNEHIDHLNLTEANLAGCDFTDAVFDGCRLAGAELRAATFTRADLRGADLGQITPMDCHALKGAYISVDQANVILAGLGLHIIK